MKNYFTSYSASRIESERRQEARLPETERRNLLFNGHAREDGNRWRSVLLENRANIKRTGTGISGVGCMQVSLEHERYMPGYVSIVIYLGEDRQNVHVKIITRRLPMSSRTRLADRNSLVISFSACKSV